ncbi:MAG: hypothetical protein LBP40_06220 [Campylobacteraceae bacterium]|jgi:hypothetical protein|nr:hypothetical protein [Campylobacteraceae bacterium]
MTKKIKNAAFIMSGGILFMLLGIFIFGALNLEYATIKDFYPPNSRDVSVFASFSVIIIGILSELFGRFALAKAANDMKIFYNRLNLYFIAALFALNSSFFAPIRIDFFENYSRTGETITGVFSVFLVILGVYFLLKDSVYFSRVSKSVLPKITFALGVISIIMFLCSIISASAFIPPLVMQLITYFKIVKTPTVHEGEEFSFYNYLASNQTRVFFVLFAAHVMLAFSIFLNVSGGAVLVFGLVIVPVVLVMSLPLLFLENSPISKKDVLLFMPSWTVFCVATVDLTASEPSLFILIMTGIIVLFINRKKIPFWIVIYAVIVGLAILDFIIGDESLLKIFIISLIVFVPFCSLMMLFVLAFCVILKLQQRGFMKASILLTLITCVLFGCIAF